MPKFEVEIIQKETYLLEIEAEDETQAESVAWKKMEINGKEEYHQWF